MRPGFVLVLLMWARLIGAQEPEWDDRWGSSAEGSAEVAGEWEALQIRLEQYRKRPLDLNTATAEQLGELGLLSPLQIDAWIRFRALFGAADSWYVFQSVPGWTQTLVLRLQAYCRLGTNMRIAQKGIRRTTTHFLLLRTSFRSADPLPKNVMGAQVNRLFRYRMQSERGWQGGLLLESDAGEALVRHGPDFISGFLQWDRGAGKMKVMVGDYSVQLGQGLICWQGMTFGAGSEVAAVKRQGMAVRPYQSVGESRFMRGLALGRSTSSWVWDLFGSRREQSATTYRLSDGRAGFRSIDASGYHRTPTEWSKKNAVTELTAGGRIGKLFSGGRINVNVLGRSWSLSRFQLSELNKRDTSWYRGVWNLGVDFSLTRGSWHVFGESALDALGRPATVVGAVIVLDRRVDLSVHLRGIGMGFQSVEGQAFQQLSAGRSERGQYMQVRVRLSESQIMDAFVDGYRVPEAGPAVSAPSVGWMRGIRWQYQPDKKNMLYVRYQSIGREYDGEQRPLPSMYTRSTRSVRIHGQFNLSDNSSLSWRTEWVKVRRSVLASESGFLSYLEWRKEIAGRIGMDLRGMWVSTDGWDSRVYAYERDVLYKVGFPAFSGELIRGYLNVSVAVGRRSMIWGRVFIEKSIDDQIVNQFGSPLQTGFTLQFRHQWGGEAL